MEKWLQYFPYKTIREQQTKALDFIFDAINSGKKYIILEAPTGVGKSAIAMTVASYFSNGKKLKSQILTTELVLQQQYINQFPQIANIWSRKRYMCEGKPGINCEMGNIMNKIVKTSGKPFCECRYEKDKKIYKDAGICLTNLAYFLQETGLQSETLKDVLIIDEAHNVDSSITDFCTINFEKYYLENYGLVWNKTNDVPSFLNWAQKVVIPRIDIKVEHLTNRSNELAKLSSGMISDDYMQTIRELNELKLYQSRLALFNKLQRNQEWSANFEPEKVTLKPIFVSRYTKEGLFNKFNTVVLMSATILDHDLFCKINGIPVSESAFLSLDSPFPKQNRPINFIDCGPLAKTSINKNLPNIIEAIKLLIDHNKGKKGIIFCNSYLVSKEIHDKVKNKRLLFHNSENRMQVLKHHIDSKEDTIIISPSLNEGIDLFDDLSRFQIIVKVPFPYLGDPFIQKKMKFIDGWYNFLTAKTIIQASGRSIRSETDFAETYILDGDFIRFLKYNIKLFPKWWLESLNMK